MDLIRMGVNTFTNPAVQRYADDSSEFLAEEEISQQSLEEDDNERMHEETPQSESILAEDVYREPEVKLEPIDEEMIE